ncbi:hypothetical protein ACH4F6_28155 [Streptomyces sp. NPDC017936]|uniref:hypothetical protein n=1 Tax=Streptomyces sp. NPDC017936 TaxID=3365016 RepID=UPI00379CFD98
MPDMTPSGEDRRGTRHQEPVERTTVAGGGRETPATTAETRSAFVEETADARTARGAGEGPARGATGEDETRGVGQEGTRGVGYGDTRGAGRDDTRDVPSAGSGTHDDRPGGRAAPQTAQTSPLLAHDECDTLAARIQHAVAEFVDHPRDSVEEADHVLEELTARFTDAVNRRRRTLRGSWQLGDDAKDDAVTTADTEQLRLALRDYRELTERLLHL